MMVPRAAGRRKTGVPLAVRGVRGCAAACGPMGGWLDPRAGGPVVGAAGLLCPLVALDTTGAVWYTRARVRARPCARY